MPCKKLTESWQAPHVTHMNARSASEPVNSRVSTEAPLTKPSVPTLVTLLSFFALEEGFYIG